ncbi:glycosyltransferase family 4 protein [Pseudanabaena sp. PCC 6802]|uniref:glycosyltransferase family 4 protein n=1 Tax=Pseudanabaena sp. PCC 6802 TaxID=118173 RepID=UPI00138B195B|nr:glycosyltransferase family 4 protein [Pseudanabaena sp. PCC 6802]
MPINSDSTNKTVDRLFVYTPNLLDRQYLKFARRYYGYLKKTPALSSDLFCPPGMRSWFSQVLDRVSPNFILMNYAYWDKLIDHRKLADIPRLIETHDLVTLNSKMQKELSRYFPRNMDSISLDQINDEILREDFFEALNLEAEREEFDIYNRYSTTIAITPREADIIRDRTSNTHVVSIPMMQKPVSIENSYSGPAIFPVGPNSFNLQGYIYFLKKVLPKVMQQIPSFRLQVTGSFGSHISVEHVDGVVFSGFIPDLTATYKQSSFLICPVFGGTGQPVKIVEAMAHGLPVVALKDAAKRSPMRHQFNGLVANNSEEFSEYVIQLWQDRNLCRQLGNAARETIASECSQDLLCDSLARVFR